MDLSVVIVMLIMPLMSMGSPSCNGKGLATYNLTFTALWSRQDFPKQYPLFRPHAQWTKTLGCSHDDDVDIALVKYIPKHMVQYLSEPDNDDPGRSHSSNYRLWDLGEIASIPLKQFAETGTSELLEAETQGNDGILDIFSTPRIDRGTGQVFSKLFVDGRHPKVSLVTRIVPSPDWFVGIDGLDLCQDGEWQNEVNIELHPHDAGSDKGYTFTAPNWPEDPPLPISVITSQMPNHPANSFYYPQKQSLPPIGRYTLMLLSSYNWVEGVDETTAGEEEEEIEEMEEQDEQEEQMEQEEREEAIEEQLEEEEQATGLSRGAIMEEEQLSTEEELAEPTEDPNAIVDCEVSEWADWAACSKTCGFGTRTRARDILQEPRNYGTPCPLLTEDELCGSMRNCGWKHFNFGGKRNQWSRSRTWIQS